MESRSGRRAITEGQDPESAASVYKGWGCAREGDEDKTAKLAHVERRIVEEPVKGMKEL